MPARDSQGASTPDLAVAALAVVVAKMVDDALDMTSAPSSVAKDSLPESFDLLGNDVRADVACVVAGRAYVVSIRVREISPQRHVVLHEGAREAGKADDTNQFLQKRANQLLRLVIEQGHLSFSLMQDDHDDVFAILLKGSQLEPAHLREGDVVLHQDDEIDGWIVENSPFRDPATKHWYVAVKKGSLRAVVPVESLRPMPTRMRGAG